MRVFAEMSALFLSFCALLCFIKASFPLSTSELGPSPMPTHDLSFPRLHGSFYSLIYQKLVLSPQGRGYFSPKQLLRDGARNKLELA